MLEQYQCTLLVQLAMDDLGFVNKVGLKRICRIFGSRSLRNYRSNIRLDTE